MSKQVLQNCKLYVDGYDFSGDMNALALDYSAEMQDNTTFGQDTRTRQGGLKVSTFAHEGYWSGGVDNVDDILFNKIGLIDVPMTVGPIAGVAGEVGFFMPVTVGVYNPGASIGDMFSFSVEGESSKDGLIRGTIMLNGTLSASGNSTARQLGAVSSSQKMFAALHVLSAGGTSPTLDVVVQSDSASGFASPSNRFTFSQKTIVSSEWATPVAGSITDDWWRINYTIGGTSPSIAFVVSVGIK